MIQFLRDLIDALRFGVKFAFAVTGAFILVSILIGVLFK